VFLFPCALQVCEAAFGRGNDDDAHFWHAVALTAEGSATEAIRELDPLQNNPEMALAVNAALINAHRSAKGQGTRDNKRARARGRRRWTTGAEPWHVSGRAALRSDEWR